jgi:hypothetical protein
MLKGRCFPITEANDHYQNPDVYRDRIVVLAINEGTHMLKDQRFPTGH